MRREWENVVEQVARELGVDLIPEEDILPGDYYLAYKNTRPYFLKCRKRLDSIVYPNTADYPFDRCDCVKVVIK